jgi:hypothetical protein
MVSALQVAFNNYWEHKVLDYLAMCFPSNQDHLKVEVNGNDFAYLHPKAGKIVLVRKQYRTKHIDVLAKLFPQLKTLTLSLPGCTSKAFIRLCVRMMENQSIRGLTLGLHKELATNAVKLLEFLISENSTLAKIHFKRRNVETVIADISRDDLDEDAILRAITSGFRRNQTIVELEMSGFQFRNINLLVDLICGSSAPKTMILRGMRILDVGSFTTSYRIPNFMTNQLEFLTLDQCMMETSSFDTLMAWIPHLPYLKRLELLYWRRVTVPWDATVSLVSIIKNATFLQHLSVHGYTLDHKQICRSLRHNTTIQKFSADRMVPDLYLNVLKFYNATLRDFGTTYYFEPTPEIQYYMDLNRLGRNAARNPKTTRPVFVEHLCRAIHGHSEMAAYTFVYDLFTVRPFARMSLSLVLVFVVDRIISQLSQLINLFL